MSNTENTQLPSQGRFKRTRLNSLAGIDEFERNLRRISEAREEEDHEHYRSPFFTITAHDAAKLHYSAHLMEKSAGNTSAESGDENERNSVKFRNNIRKNSVQNKLVNCKAVIEDESSNNNANNQSGTNTTCDSKHKSRESRNSIFDIFPDIAKGKSDNDIPSALEAIDAVLPVDEIKNLDDKKKQEEKLRTMDQEKQLEQKSENGSKTLNSTNDISLESSDLTFKEQIGRRKSKYRISIVNDNQSNLSTNKKEIKRRKSLHPSEAFNASEEVDRARRLSIFAQGDWDNTHIKRNQRIIIKKNSFSLEPSDSNIDDKQKIIDKNVTLPTTQNITTINKKTSNVNINNNNNNNNNNKDNIEKINNVDNISETSIDMSEEHHEEHHKFDTLKMFLINICMIYGLVMSIIGIAISIAAVVTDSKNEELANNIEYFFMYLFITSIIWILYCLHDIRKYKFKERKLGSNENEEDNKEDSSSYKSKKEDNFFDKIFLNNLKNIKNYFQIKYDALNFKIKVKIFKMDSIEDKNKKDNNQMTGYYYDYKYGAGGLYLKVGVAVFCTVSLINTALVIAEMAERGKECRRGSALASQILFFCFQFIQFYFIFKHSNLIIHNFKGLARLAVIHIVVTNLCVWIRTIIIETEEQYHMIHSGSEHKDAYSVEEDVYNCSTGISHVRPVQQLLAPYLYPCTIEYSITCLTIFYIIWQNVGKKNKHFGYILKTNELETIFNIDCHKTSRGLFCGIIVLLVTVVTNIMYFIYKDGPEASKIVDSQHAIVVRAAAASTYSNQYSTTAMPYEPDPESTIIIEVLELVLISLSAIIVINAIIRTRKLAIIEHGSMVFDEALVVLSLCGIYIFSVFSALSIIYTKRRDSIAYMTLTISILSMIEGTLQTYLILDGLRRRAVEQNDRKKKPGRELFTLLIIINLSLWISDTFAFKRFEVNPYQLEYYSILAWSIINTISSPLAIFFRFHASVCLSDCWKSIYL